MHTINPESQIPEFWLSLVSKIARADDALQRQSDELEGMDTHRGANLRYVLKQNEHAKEALAGALDLLRQIGAIQ